MSITTILPTNFDESLTPSQYFRKLAKDAEKFPENYINAIVIHTAEGMEEMTYHCLNDISSTELVGLLETTKYRILQDGDLEDEYYQ